VYVSALARQTQGEDMRIAVCIKQVPDVRAPLVINEKGPSIIEEEACYVTNRPDKVAVEEAVRIKEKLGKGEVTLVSLGSKRIERTLRECLALGANRAIILTSLDFNEADAYATAEILAGALKALRPDLILCGSFAEDTEYGAIGIMVAEILGIPSVSNIDSINVTEDENAVIVYRKLERGNREVIRCPLPAVFTIDPGMNNPRYASLPLYMEALTSVIEQWDTSTVSFKRGKPKLEITTLALPRPRLKKGFTIDSSLPPKERIKLLMTGGVSYKEDNIIEGSPEAIANRLVSYLMTNKIIERDPEDKR
jgi:electron transfer flavoprotein beta subunit